MLKFTEDKFTTEYEQLWTIVNRIDKRITCNHGKTALYQQIIADIKAHTDKTKIKRG